jgi:hypothetical protein
VSRRRQLQRILAAPELNIGAFAFLLNYPWEFLQVPFFAGMADAPHWEAMLFCSRAAVGDAGIAVVAFWAVAVAVRRRSWLVNPTTRQVLSFVASGLVITVILEWLATEVWNRWEYAAMTPTLPVLGTGLLPVLQWSVLPPLLVWIVRRQLLGSSRSAGDA